MFVVGDKYSRAKDIHDQYGGTRQSGISPSGSHPNGFSKLLQFQESEGHCKVPLKFKLDDYKLESWVGTQRTRQASLSAERKQRLDDIGFIWDASKDQT